MRTRILLLAVSLGGSGCVSTRSAETTRDAIHWFHTQCLAQAKVIDFRAMDAMRVYQCDFEEERACLEAGLERRCSEWQWGGT